MTLDRAALAALRKENEERLVQARQELAERVALNESGVAPPAWETPELPQAVERPLLVHKMFDQARFAPAIERALSEVEDDSDDAFSRTFEIVCDVIAERVCAAEKKTAAEIAELRAHLVEIKTALEKR